MKKITLKRKKVLYKDSFNPDTKSKYAQKKVKQLQGIYSPTSPFRIKEKI